MQKVLWLCSCLCFSLLANNAGAAVSYWDPNGTTSVGGNGTWDNTTTEWSTNAAGTQVASASLRAWTAGNAACFCADAGGSTLNPTPFTITVNTANISCAGIFNGTLNPALYTITISGTGSLSLPNTVCAWTAQFNSSANQASTTVNIPINGTGPIQKTGGATTAFNGNNTFTGGFQIFGGGAVNFGNNNAFGTGTITWQTGGFIQPTTSAAFTIGNAVQHTNSVIETYAGNTGGVTFSGPQHLWTSGTTTLNNISRTITISGAIDGAAALAVKVTAGTGWTFTGVNTFTSALTITSGTLTIGGAGSLNSGNYGGAIANSGTFTYASSAAQALSGAISGAGPLNKSGSGTLTLSGANTYSGTTTITAGTLKLGAAGGMPSGNGKGILNIVSPGVFDVAGLTGSADGVTGNGVVTNSTGTGTLNVGSAGTNSAFTGLILNTSAPLNLTKSGAGTFTISGANTYSGVTTVSAGTLQLGADNTIPAGSSVIVANGATLDMNSLNDTIAALSGAGSVINNNATLTINGNANLPAGQNFNGYSCIAGMLSGSGTFVKAGTHAMALRGDNSAYGGPITFSGGTLSVGAAANRLPAGMALSVPSGALFQLDANNQTVATLNGSGSVNLGGGILTLDQNGSDTFNGVIQNSELAGSSTAAGHGLRGYYYTNIDFTGLGAVRDDNSVNLADMSTLPSYPKTNQISVRWLGQVLTTAGGQYVFTTKCDDGQRLWVGGTLLVDDWNAHAPTVKSGTNTLAANTRYDIVMEYFNNTVGGAAQLFWTPPGDSSVIIPSANLFLPGPGTLVMNGSGVQQLTIAGTYSGGTTVNAGTLDATANGALGSGNVAVADGATLQLDSSAGINSGADLIASASATAINLSYAGTDNIHALSLDGGNSYQPAGTYGSFTSSAAHQSSLFIGSGILNVTANPSANVLTSSGVSPVYGSSLNLTSTITGSGATPTGTVTFYDNGNFLGSAALSVSGVATFSVSNLLVTASPHSLTAVYSGDAHYAASSSNPVSVTTTVATIVPNPVVANKTYDGTNTATIASITFGGILDSDTNYVHISGAYTATFSDKNVGVNKSVNITGLALTGSLSGNYVLSTTSVSTTASITNKALTISGITATNRVYDANTDEGVTGTAVLNAGVISPDVVTLSGSAVVAFTTKTSGLAKPVTVGGYSITGADAGNYILVLTNLIANITNFPVAVTGVTANNKAYDGGTNASLSGTATLSPAVFGGDVVTLGGAPVASFATATVGTGKPVTVTGYALSGGDASNYTLSQPVGLTANITQAGTSAAITSSVNPSTLTSNVTFKVTVTATTPTTNPPTGNVTFFTNGVAVIPVVTLVSNTPTSSIASYTTGRLPAGTNTVAAAYGGDPNFSAALQVSLQQVVQSTVCSQTNALLSITPNGGNSFTLNFAGTYQAQYYVVAQTNLTQPMANWQPVPGSTNTVSNPSGLWSVTVTNPAPAFYRSKAMSVCQ